MPAGDRRKGDRDGRVRDPATRPGRRGGTRRPKVRRRCERRYQAWARRKGHSSGLNSSMTPSTVASVMSRTLTRSVWRRSSSNALFRLSVMPRDFFGGESEEPRSVVVEDVLLFRGRQKI